MVLLERSIKKGMRVIIGIALMFTQMTVKVFSQSFEFIYTTANHEVINDAVEDSNGNFYFAGIQGIYSTFPNGMYSGLVIKINEQGDTISTFLKTSVDSIFYLNNVVLVGDSSVLITGTVFNSTISESQVLYLRLDTALNLIEEKIIGNPIKYEVAQNLKLSKQNQLLISGFANTNTDNEIFLYRLSLAGDSLQSFYLGDSLYSEQGFDILELPDNSGFLLFTLGWSFHLTNPVPAANDIVKLDSTGIVDTVVYIPNSAFISTAKWLSDTAFVVHNGGYNPFASSFNYDLRLSKFDINFNLLADTLMGTIDTNDAESRGLDFIDPDKIFMGGTTNYTGSYFSPDPAYFYLIQLDNNIVPRWQKFIGHNDDYLTLYKVLATKDGGVLLIGTKYNDLSSGANESDIYAIKLDSLGNFITSTDNLNFTTVSDVLVFPNPAAYTVTIKSAVQFNAQKISLINAKGKVCLEKQVSYSTSIDIGSLSSGLYFYKIENDKGENRNGKILITH